VRMLHGGSAVEFRVLGPVEVRTATDTVVQFRGKQAAVIGLLALRGGQPVGKEFLHEAIWRGESLPNALETTIGRIRRRLGLTKDGEVLITEKDAAYRLEADTDIAHFQDAAKRGDDLRAGDRQADAIGAYNLALTHWRGEPLRELSDVAEVSPEVTSLRLRLWVVKFRRIELLAAGNRWDEVFHGIEPMLEEDPCFDAGYYYKIQALQHIRGVNAAATAVYEACKTLRDNGIEPPRDLRALQDQILKILGGDAEHQGLEPALADVNPQPSPAEQQVSEIPSTEVGVIVHNLPAPTYMTFVARPRQWAQIVQALGTGLPIIALIGIGGNGKSTLAREFASDAAERGEMFSLLVWVSDREVPGSTTLTTVLDEIAAAADYPGLASRTLPEKKLQTIRILRRTATLLVIDSHETITDKEMDRWLRNVPPPSKVLLTSIVHPRDLESYCYEIEIGGMEDDQRGPFYDQLLERQNLQDLSEMGDALANLWAAANGNPKLIEWAVGQVKRRGRSLADLTEEIDKTKSRTDDSGEATDIVLRDLFRDSWQAMTPAAQDLLTAVACFPHGVTSKVLRQVLGGGQALEDALEQLIELCFITRMARSEGEESWYLADPLAANRRNTRLGPRSGPIHDRWLSYCVDLAEAVGFCPDDISKLVRLDVPGVRENLEYAITWAFGHGHYQAAIRIARGVRYYYYVRGLWSAEPNVHLLRAEAARQTGDFAEEFDARVFFVNIAAKQENLAVFTEQLPRLEELLGEHAEVISAKSLTEYRHSRALYLLAKEEYAAAEEEWRRNLADPEILGPANYNANLRWRAICLARSGPAHTKEAIRAFEIAKTHAAEHHYDRALFFVDLELASMTLDQAPHRSAVGEILTHLLEPAMLALLSSHKDRRYMADHEWLLARCYEQLGQRDDAAIHSEQAAELYERLGLTERARIARAGDEIQ
jgi:DNA-binding SARP family transcriptional activator